MTLHFDSSVAAMAFVFLLLLLAVVGGIGLNFFFLSPRNQGKYQGAPGAVYDFLTFRKLIIEGVLRFCYVLTTCVLTVFGVIQLFTREGLGHGLLWFLLYGVVGNLAVRLVYELFLMLILLCRNIMEINRKMRCGPRPGPPLFEASFSQELLSENMRKKMVRFTRSGEDVQEEKTYLEK